MLHRVMSWPKNFRAAFNFPFFAQFERKAAKFNVPVLSELACSLY